MWGASLVVNLLVGSLPGRKSACGEPPAKRTTGLSYPRSASASQTPSQPASKPAKLLVGSLPGRNSACGEALGLKWISVWNPMYVVVCSPGGLPLGFHMYIKKSVGSLPGRKSACGEPPAKRPTGLFCPRSASLCLSGPLYIPEYFFRDPYLNISLGILT